MIANFDPTMVCGTCLNAYGGAATIPGANGARRVIATLVLFPSGTWHKFDPFQYAHRAYDRTVCGRPI